MDELFPDLTDASTSALIKELLTRWSAGDQLASFIVLDEVPQALTVAGAPACVTRGVEAWLAEPAPDQDDLVRWLLAAAA